MSSAINEFLNKFLALCREYEKEIPPHEIKNILINYVAKLDSKKNIKNYPNPLKIFYLLKGSINFPFNNFSFTFFLLCFFSVIFLYIFAPFEYFYLKILLVVKILFFFIIGLVLFLKSL